MIITARYIWISIALTCEYAAPLQYSRWLTVLTDNDKLWSIIELYWMKYLMRSK